MGCVSSRDEGVLQPWYVHPDEQEDSPLYLPHTMTRWQRGRVDDLWDELALRGLRPERRLTQVAEQFTDHLGGVAVSTAPCGVKSPGTTPLNPAVQEADFAQEAGRVESKYRPGHRVAANKLIALSARTCRPGKLTPDTCARLVGNACESARTQARLLFVLSNRGGTPWISRHDLGLALYVMNARRPNREATKRQQQQDVERVHQRWADVARLVCCCQDQLAKERFIDSAEELAHLVYCGTEIVHTLDDEQWARWRDKNEERLAEQAADGGASVPAIQHPEAEAEEDPSWHEAVAQIRRAKHVASRLGMAAQAARDSVLGTSACSPLSPTSSKSRGSTAGRSTQEPPDGPSTGERPQHGAEGGGTAVWHPLPTPPRPAWNSGHRWAPQTVPTAPSFSTQNHTADASSQDDDNPGLLVELPSSVRTPEESPCASPQLPERPKQVWKAQMPRHVPKRAPTTTWDPVEGLHSRQTSASSKYDGPAANGSETPTQVSAAGSPHPSAHTTGRYPSSPNLQRHGSVGPQRLPDRQSSVNISPQHSAHNIDRHHSSPSLGRRRSSAGSPRGSFRQGTVPMGDIDTLGRRPSALELSVMQRRSNQRDYHVGLDSATSEAPASGNSPSPSFHHQQKMRELEKDSGARIIRGGLRHNPG